MTTIAVIGAAGNVGTELCVTLSQYEGVRLIAICRSNLEAALLKRCGIVCRIGSIEKDASILLEGVDTVVDLAIPRGLPSDFRRSTRHIIQNVLNQSPSSARYIFSSSIMAFGMKDPEERWIKSHLLAHSLYGIKKRWAEREVLRSARKKGREAYILRFGQVHGEIQNSTERLISDISSVPQGDLYLVPKMASNTLFVTTIADAVINISSGLEKPGLYTLVSNPQLSWKEIVEYYTKRNKLTVNTLEVEIPNPRFEIRWRSILYQLMTRLFYHRDLAAGYLLAPFPNFELSAKAKNSIWRASSELSIVTEKENEVFRSAYFGEPPGRKLSSLNDSKKPAFQIEDKVREVFAKAIRS